MRYKGISELPDSFKVKPSKSPAGIKIGKGQDVTLYGLMYLEIFPKENKAIVKNCVTGITHIVHPMGPNIKIETKNITDIIKGIGTKYDLMRDKE